MEQLVYLVLMVLKVRPVLLDQLVYKELRGFLEQLEQQVYLGQLDPLVHKGQLDYKEPLVRRELPEPLACKEQQVYPEPLEPLGPMDRLGLPVYKDLQEQRD